MIRTIDPTRPGSGGDALRVWLTGGAANTDPDASLGGARSLAAGGEVFARGVRPSGGPRHLVIERVTAANGLGHGVISAAGPDALTWTAPQSSTPGSPVVIAAGETKLLLDGADADKGVVVTRTGAEPLFGSVGVLLTDEFNGLVGFRNVTSAETAGGADHYRAAMLVAGGGAGGLGIVDLRIWIAALGTGRATDAAQLGASGAGSIETSAGGGFGDWEDRPVGAGFARIETAGGALREIVYYTSRTATELTVPAGGRGLLGSTSGAGAADDVVYPVAGLRLGLEAPEGPVGAGEIQSIADEGTEPADIDWTTGIRPATGLVVPSLAPGAEMGLWIHRHVPVG